MPNWKGELDGDALEGVTTIATIHGDAAVGELNALLKRAYERIRWLEDDAARTYRVHQTQLADAGHDLYCLRREIQCELDMNPYDPRQVGDALRELKAQRDTARKSFADARAERDLALEERDALVYAWEEEHL